ncbi:hypothetical protein [Nonomuraea zeae]|uniref:Uncharacterized protein n=1 Tax=Nonomuraea zeae TaxID=1642303 RepID=A0A5S4GZ02_9ACTN|nr:hypothetical protein [Nonomuraea zeae]TMR31740.1 hypothetical protein ETD85_24950 [Nonomuraea zeae]
MTLSTLIPEAGDWLGYRYDRGDCWDEPTYEDAPYTEQSLAQLALAATAQELADFLIGFVAVWSDYNPRPVEDAARFVRRAQELLDRAVIVEKVGGASWEDIGDTLEITRQSAHAKFLKVTEEWEEAVKRPIVTDEMYGISGGLETRTYNRMPAGTATPDETAAYLDKWALAHAQADGRDVGERPVSGGRARMTPLVEMMSLSSGPLFDEFASPPPHLLAEISQRARAPRGTPRSTPPPRARRPPPTGPRTPTPSRSPKPRLRTSTRASTNGAGPRRSGARTGPSPTWPPRATGAPTATSGSALSLRPATTRHHAPDHHRAARDGRFSYELHGSCRSWSYRGHWR